MLAAILSLEREDPITYAVGVFTLSIWFLSACHSLRIAFCIVADVAATIGYSHPILSVVFCLAGVMPGIFMQPTFLDSTQGNTNSAILSTHSR
jgi:uncharacterized membrane protein